VKMAGPCSQTHPGCVGPKRAGHYGLRAQVEVTGARNAPDSEHVQIRPQGGIAMGLFGP
jgi:hypothetical protein